MRKEIINCLMFEVLVEKLIEIIRPHKDMFDIVYGIPTGGLVPATYISKRLQLEQTCFLNLEGQNILLVDDLTDTGKTMRKYINMFETCKCITTAVIYYKPHKLPLPSFKPDFYVKETLDWIVFPWENLEEKPNRKMYEHL